MKAGILNSLNMNFIEMKKTVIAVLVCLSSWTTYAQSGNVGINTDGSTADPSALLDVKSTNQGVLIPRMTSEQRGLISSPATGLMVFQTDEMAGFYFYNGSAWTSLSGASQKEIDVIVASIKDNAVKQEAINAVINANISQNTNDIKTNATNITNLSKDYGTLKDNVNEVAKKVLPAGGTANQVLSKIDGTDYNTQWVTPTTSGATLVLSATNTSSTAILANANGTNTGDLVNYNNVVTLNNSFGSYSGNTFTVSQAGIYMVEATTRVQDNATPSSTLNQFLYVDIDNQGLGGVNNILPMYPGLSGSNMPAGARGRGHAIIMLSLVAGQTINIKGLTANSSTPGTALKTDGSCKFIIVKM